MTYLRILLNKIETLLKTYASVSFTTGVPQLTWCRSKANRGPQPNRTTIPPDAGGNNLLSVTYFATWLESLSAGITDLI